MDSPDEKNPRISGTTFYTWKNRTVESRSLQHARSGASESVLHAVAFASAHSCNCFISSSSSDQAKLLSWSRLNSRRTEPANSHILREHTVLVSPWTWEGVGTRSHLHNVTQSYVLFWVLQSCKPLKTEILTVQHLIPQDLLAQADDHM